MLVVDDRVDAGGAERFLDALAETGLGHEAVADDEGPRDPELPEVLTRLGRGTRAEDDARGVERDDRAEGVAHGRLASGSATAAATAAIASSIEITSPYFASMSTQRPVVGVDRPVRHALPRHQHPVAVLERIDRRRPHAARGGRAGDQHRVAARLAEHLVELRAEERGREELDEHRLVRSRREPRVDLDPGRARAQRRERGRLGDEHRGPLEVVVGVADRREDDGNAAPRAALRVERARVAPTAASASHASADAGFVKPSMKSTTTTAGRRPAPWRPPKPRAS